MGLKPTLNRENWATKNLSWLLKDFHIRLVSFNQNKIVIVKNVITLFDWFQDVAEDMYDAKTSTEAISRRRQRNEICVTLKRSRCQSDKI